VQLPLCVWASSNRFSNSTQRATSVFICFRYSVVFGSRCGKIELQFNATLGGKRDELLVGNPFSYIRHRRCVTSLGDSNGFSRRFLAHNKLKLGHNITVNKCHRISVLTSVCVCSILFNNKITFRCEKQVHMILITYTFWFWFDLVYHSNLRLSRKIRFHPTDFIVQFHSTKQYISDIQENQFSKCC